MSAYESGVFNVQEFTDLGDPLVGGRLYTYVFGTTTLKTAYTDAAGLVPHTYTNDGLGGQYIALDARGELPAPLYLLSGSYDLALKRADGSTVWTRRADPGADATSLASTATGAGASLIGIADAGSYYTATNVETALQEIAARAYGINVTDPAYGALGDGTTDDRAAFLAAISASVAQNNRAIFMPSGRQYKIGGSITVPTGIMFVGEGSQGSTPGKGCSITHAANGDLFVCDASGADFAGTGGGFMNVLITKASGFTGGDAIRFISTSDNKRPGELWVSNVLIYATSGGQWARGFVIDGTASDTPGGRGVRDVHIHKLRVAGCSTNDKYIYLNQACHVMGFGWQISQGNGTGTAGMTIEGNWDGILLGGLECYGNVVMAAPTSADVYTATGVISGFVTGSFTQTGTRISGHAQLGDVTTLSVASGTFRVDSNRNRGFAYRTNTVKTGVTGAGVEYIVQFDTVLGSDPQSEYNTSTGRYTPVTAGLKQMSGFVTVGGLAAANARMDIYYRRYNASAVQQEVRQIVLNPANSFIAGGILSVPFNFVSNSFALTDYATISVSVNSGTQIIDVRTEGTMLCVRNL